MLTSFVVFAVPKHECQALLPLAEVIALIRDMHRLTLSRYQLTEDFATIQYVRNLVYEPRDV